MYRFKMLLALGVVALAATGCANKLRVTTRLRPHKLGHYAGDGGVLVTKSGNVCVAPPAQAATTIKIDLENSANAKVKDAVEAALTSKAKFEESLHTLYEQGQATLYLQFMAYRLCEAKLNGWIDEASYMKQLEEIRAMGKELITLELSREQEETKQKQQETQQEEARSEQLRQQTLGKILDDPDTSPEVRRGLEEKLLTSQ